MLILGTKTRSNGKSKSYIVKSYYVVLAKERAEFVLQPHGKDLNLPHKYYETQLYLLGQPFRPGGRIREGYKLLIN